MAKLTLTDISATTIDPTVSTAINANNTALETALENTLSRDGTTPNTMAASLDMDSNRILNLPDAVSDGEPVTRGQFDALIPGVIAPNEIIDITTNVSGMGTGVATFLATPSSANLLAAVTDETGTGALVFGTSPTLVTPALGTPSALVLTNATGLPVAGGGTGASSATTGFNNLSPTTTRGDIIRRGAANNERLALGTSGYHLVSDGTDVTWAGFLNSGAGATARSWQTRLRDTVSVKDFGAVGDATTDDTTAIQNAINSGATSIYFPNGTYKVTSTILLSEKVGVHMYGDSGGSNGLGASKIYWGGAANGVILQVYSCSDCTIERIALQGIYGGVETNPGTGLLINGTNADGSVHHNTFRNMSISAISGSPGYGILFGSGTNDDIADNLFDKILIVDTVIAVVQFGNQTVHNKYHNIQCLEYTSKGMQFIDGDIRLSHCSFFGTSAATVDVEVGTACLWATIRDSYHEILTGRSVGSSSAYSFPTGTRLYGTRLDSCRVLWDIASGNIINYLQNGPVSIPDLIVDGLGAGTLTVTVGGSTVRPVSITNPTYVATVNEAITGPVSRLDFNGSQVIPQVQTSVLSSSANGTNVATAQPWFGDATGQDSFTPEALTSYRFKGMLITTRAAGSTAHQMSLLFGGTATLTSIHYIATSTTSTGAPIASTTPSQMFGAAATALTVTPSSTSTTENITVMVEGVVRINATGTFIPQFQYSAAPGGAPTILADTFFEMWPIGSNTVQKIGNWS